jgi:hypothetical protein
VLQSPARDGVDDVRNRWMRRGSHGGGAMTESDEVTAAEFCVRKKGQNSGGRIYLYMLWPGGPAGAGLQPVRNKAEIAPKLKCI